MTKDTFNVPAGLIVTVGLPGSGKTTWAQLRIDHSPDTVGRANRDSLRIAQSGRRRVTGRQEQVVTEVQDALITAQFTAGFTTVIVDDTNLHGLSRFAVLAARLGVELHVQDFRHVPLATCIQRDSLRTGAEHVGEAAIRKMHDRDVLPHLRRLARDNQLARRATA